MSLTYFMCKHKTRCKFTWCTGDQCSSKRRTHLRAVLLQLTCSSQSWYSSSHFGRSCDLSHSFLSLLLKPSTRLRCHLGLCFTPTMRNNLIINLVLGAHSVVWVDYTLSCKWPKTCLHELSSDYWNEIHEIILVETLQTKLCLLSLIWEIWCKWFNYQ